VSYAQSEELDPRAALALRRSLDSPVRLDRLGNLQAAYRAGAKNVLRELFLLSRRPGKLTVDEYFYYTLYDLAFSPDQRARFVGKRTQTAMHHACNDVRWFAIADDKLLFYSFMRGADLPIPETLATYDAKGRSAFCRTLPNKKALRDFLADDTAYPLFLKPTDGMYSIGALRLQQATKSGIILKSGQEASLDDIVTFVSDYGKQGYLLQRILQPHADLIGHFGTTLPSIRFLVLLGDDGAAVESAVVKIPRSHNVADNYWRSGNMLGAVNKESGIIERVVTGAGDHYREVTTHDDTGASLTGYKLPDWLQATSLCLKAATMFPGIRTQSWDIALSDKGPVLMELNFGGDLNLHQLAHRRGILSTTYIKHLKSCGYRGALPQL
jgi:hypothetical protein